MSLFNIPINVQSEKKKKLFLLRSLESSQDNLIWIHGWSGGEGGGIDGADFCKCDTIKMILSALCAWEAVNHAQSCRMDPWMIVETLFSPWRAVSAADIFSLQVINASPCCRAQRSGGPHPVCCLDGEVRVADGLADVPHTPHLFLITRGTAALVCVLELFSLPSGKNIVLWLFRPSTNISPSTLNTISYPSVAISCASCSVSYPRRPTLYVDHVSWFFC